MSVLEERTGCASGIGGGAMPTARKRPIADEDKTGPLLKHIICPHCWHHFETSGIVWVAKHEDLRGDPVLANEEAYLRFLPTRFTVHGDAIDSRGMACEKLACPRCHLLIPRAFLNYEPLIFSLIGVPFSGKSYFLTSMAWELSRILPTQFSLVFQDLDAASNETFIEYRQKFFLQDDPHQPVGIVKTQQNATSHYDTTTLDGQTTLLPRPLLFSLRPIGRGGQGSKSVPLGRVLCLYDNAGEQFLVHSDTADQPGTQHMARSRVLMFMFDPTQDPRIREACRKVSNDPQLRERAQTLFQAPILTEAATRVREHAHLSSTEKLRQPLMILVGKSDIWGRLVDEDLTTDPYVPPDPPERDHALVNLRRIRSVSAKVRAFLQGLAPEFVATAEDCCEEVVYIPVSALGCSPVSPGEGQMLMIKAADIKPRWVTVPMLYAFSVWAKRLLPARGV